jgi:hypothetical protein
VLNTSPYGHVADRLNALLRRFWSLCSHRFRELAAIATAVGVAVALWSERKALVDFDWRLAPGSFAVAIVLFAVAPFVQAVLGAITARDQHAADLVTSPRVTDWSRPTA